MSLGDRALGEDGLVEPAPGRREGGGRRRPSDGDRVFSNSLVEFTERHREGDGPGEDAADREGGDADCVTAALESVLDGRGGNSFGEREGERKLSLSLADAVVDPRALVG